MNWFERLTAKLPTWLHNFVDHNRYTAAGFLLIFLMNGCALTDMLSPKVASPITGEKATRAKLEEERNIYYINLETEREALNAEIKAKIEAFNTRGKVMEEKWGGAFKKLEKDEALITNVLALSTSLPGSSLPEILLGLLGASGLIYGGAKQLDNGRKDAVIEQKKQENRALLAGSPIVQ
jgi:hypothetical protein